MKMSDIVDEARRLLRGYIGTERYSDDLAPRYVKHMLTSHYEIMLAAPRLLADLLAGVDEVRADAVAYADAAKIQRERAEQAERERDDWRARAETAYVDVRSAFACRDTAEREVAEMRRVNTSLVSAADVARFERDEARAERESAMKVGRAAVQNWQAAERERDAYRRAKQENDERFQAEAIDARRERDEARAERDEVMQGLRDAIRDGDEARAALAELASAYQSYTENSSPSVVVDECRLMIALTEARRIVGEKV